MADAESIDHWLTFEEILTGSWQLLLHGTSQTGHPFHTPVLGTAGRDGSRLRTVVLRQVSESERLLFCHTDIRSDKIADIRQHPQASWLFYHPEQKIQLRLTGPVTLHTDDDLADRQWATTRLMSRRTYCTLQGPGTVIDRPASGLPDFLTRRIPTLLESEAGRKNFAVIAGRIDSLEWLYLRARGHRRACFVWRESNYSASWLVP